MTISLLWCIGLYAFVCMYSVFHRTALCSSCVRHLGKIIVLLCFCVIEAK